MLRTIPTAATPNQSFSVVLQERNVNIALRTLAGQLYADVVCEGVPICATRVCQDRAVFTGRAEHLGFPSLRLCFADLLGVADPQWEGLGTRFLLFSVELSADEEARLAQQVIDAHAALTLDSFESFDGGVPAA